MTSSSNFWSWFLSNSPRIAAALQSEDRDTIDAIVKETGIHLHEFNLDLAHEFSTQPVEGKMEFIISADGISSSIPAVKQLVAAAPEIPGWKVIAFRGPHHDVDGLSFKGADFDLRRLRFTITKSTRKDRVVDIVVYGPGLHIGNKRSVHAVFLLFDTLIGEYAVMTQVGDIDFQPLSQLNPPDTFIAAEFAAAFNLMAQEAKS